MQELKTAIAASELPASDIESLTPAQRRGELAMLMLRLSRGLHFNDFTAATGGEARKLFAEPIERLAKLWLIEVDTEAVRLTESGLNVADAVAAEFLLDE